MSTPTHAKHDGAEVFQAIGVHRHWIETMFPVLVKHG
jgi:hypothetical protein